MEPVLHLINVSHDNITTQTDAAALRKRPEIAYISYSLLQKSRMCCGEHVIVSII
jgi:hypothetical protein